MRINHPGICAYFYDCMLEIVIEEVIGWDLKKNEARPGGSLFGIPIAFTSSTEEQGRKTLHSHFLIWLKNFQERIAKLYSANQRERKAAQRDLCNFIDSISSCSLFDQSKFGQGQPRTAFPHDCPVQPQFRKLPVVVEDQELRFLRHEEGEKALNRRFAYCPHCVHCWTNEELVQSYLIYGAKIEGLMQYPDSVKRLKAMAVEYQKSPAGSLPPKIEVINAAYSQHMHATKGCFGSSEPKKRKAPTCSNRECRYRYPQSKRKRTCIENVSESPMKWFAWDGTFSEIHVKEVIIRRHPFDAFQNVSCPAISQSKLSCNSNIALLMPGPIGQYTFKYHIKKTQKDDTEEYERVKEATQKVLSRLKKDATEVSTSIQRVLAASFAHQKTNVVGGAMCAFLTRKKKRFIFSHETVWCPLRDLKALLNGRKVNAMLSQNKNSPFYICSAMNYLCRPSELEDFSAYDFYAQYEAKQKNASNDEALYEFCNVSFIHPSFQTSTQTFRQGVQERENLLLPKILQYDFPDTAQFGGPLLQPTTLITEPLETYSELVLLLFTPYRTLDDIQDGTGSFTRKLREVHSAGGLSEDFMQFLQNVQDAKANCFRAGRPDDLLQRTTEPFMPADTSFDQQTSPDEDDIENGAGLEGAELDELLELLGEGPEEGDEEEGSGCVLPKSLNLAPIRQKGVHSAGYSHIAKMQSNTQAASCAYETTGNTYMDADQDGDPDMEEPKKDPPK